MSYKFISNASISDTKFVLAIFEVNAIMSKGLTSRTRMLQISVLTQKKLMKMMMNNDELDVVSECFETEDGLDQN